MCKTFLTYSHVSRYLIFFYLSNFRNKLLLYRLTLWWEEMNLIGQFFLVDSPGCLEQKLTLSDRDTSVNRDGNLKVAKDIYETKETVS